MSKSFVAVLFADVVGSTSLYERVGDDRAKDMVLACLAGLAQVVEGHGGRVVKSLGDGILCCFPARDQALLAAVALSDVALQHELEVTAGVHCGDVVEENGDIFGDTVNTTARVASLAKPGEILLSQDMLDAVPPMVAGLVNPVQPVQVKGKREPLALHAIHSSDLSQTLSQMTVADAPVTSTDTTLEVRFGDRRWTLGRGDSLSMGRGPANDLVIASNSVSRHHAQIFHRQDKFVLKDQSSNGSFLVPERALRLHVLREEALLHGTGRLYLGADPDNTPSEPIEYEVH
ncbi:MAG: adenylate/guanylate cyclase domain-containing protein [Planctomycetota bacterium]